MQQVVYDAAGIERAAATRKTVVDSHVAAGAEIERAAAARKVAVGSHAAAARKMSVG